MSCSCTDAKSRKGDEHAYAFVVFVVCGSDKGGQ